MRRIIQLRKNSFARSRSRLGGTPGPTRSGICSRVFAQSGRYSRLRACGWRARLAPGRKQGCRGPHMQLAVRARPQHFDERPIAVRRSLRGSEPFEGRGRQLRDSESSCLMSCARRAPQNEEQRVGKPRQATRARIQSPSGFRLRLSAPEYGNSRV